MYGGAPYAGGSYAGSLASEADIPSGGKINTAIEVAFTTDPLSPSPVFVDIGGDARWWDVSRGRSGELERFQPGRATVVLSNLDRQYDSVNAAGPWFGYLKPMRRLRIRETINGVTYPQFDGFIDRWQLDYPDVGKDATATVTATDLFKVLARTDLPLSVYHDLLLDDAPELYWRLDETKNADEDTALTALNSGTLASAADGAYVGPPELGGERLVVNDPGTSAMIVSSETMPGTEDMGARIEAAAFSLTPAANASFVVECWCIPQAEPGANATLFTQRHTGGTDVHVYYTLSNTFVINTFPGALSPSASSSPTTYPPHKRYHIVAKVVPGETVKLWVNGVLHDDGEVADGAWDAPGPLCVGYLPGSPSLNWVGMISHVAVWRGTAAQAFGQADVDAHYEAGTHPWQGDTPAGRADRVLDIVGVPANLRDLDAGDVTFQSAETFGQTALEHLQKVGETEFGLVFVARDGVVTLVDKFSQEARTSGVVFGDGVGEVGYRNIVPDDGTIRNRATISRLNGVAKNAVDAASVSEYGPGDYVLEGLLHDSDAYSQSYADWIVTEFGDLRRTITTLEVGPPIPDEEDDVWPVILGREIGELVTVRSRPIGGGLMFEQVCVVEGIRHAGSPGGDRKVTLTLSPEFTEPLF